MNPIRLVVACVAAVATPAVATAPQQRAVVELFTSQGCSSCPPANAAVGRMAARPDVIALSFGVTYWDHLGWKDTFADPAFTARQRTYAKALGRSPYTPQVVVNGRADTVGGSTGLIDGVIRRAQRAPGPKITLAESRVAIEAAGAPARIADVWLVRYDPRTVQVPIKRGENGGKTLPYRNVVKTLVRLGAWRGGDASFALPAAAQGLRTAVLVQAPSGGPILAAVADG